MILEVRQDLSDSHYTTTNFEFYLIITFYPDVQYNFNVNLPSYRMEFFPDD